MFIYSQWSQAIAPDEWLNAIKSDIKKKYNSLNPKFCHDELPLSYDQLNKLKIDRFWTPILWVKYKYIENDFFDLKPFSPWPDDKISMDIIDIFLNKLLYGNNAQYFCLNYYEWDYENDLYIDVPGKTIYNYSEIRIELRFLLRQGFSKVELINTTTLDTGEIIFHIHVGQDSIENMVKSGFLELEYK
jgi:hypothetical protein